MANLGVHDYAELTQDLSKLLQLLWPLLAAPLSVASFVYACLYAYVYATVGQYNENDWERCLTVPNIGSLTHDHNKFCTSAANFIGQGQLALLVSALGTFVGLRDSALLPFSLFTSVVGLLGLLVFRESYPYYDVPQYMSTTLITLTRYIHPNMYNDLREYSHLPPELRRKIPENDICRTAYKINVGFLCIQYGVLSLAIVLLVIDVYCWFHRPARRYHSEDWSGRSRPAFILFIVLGMVGITTMFISKERVAAIALDVAAADKHDTTYPFLDNNLDIVSFTSLTCIGCAIYALCKPSLMPFLLTAGVGLVNAIRSVPGLLGTIAGYSGVWYPHIERSGRARDLLVRTRYYVIWDTRQCTDYVIQTNKAAFTSDPQAEHHAKRMCHMFISSITGQLLTWMSIVGLAVLAIWTLCTDSAYDRSLEGASSDCEDDWPQKGVPVARGKANGGLEHRTFHESESDISESRPNASAPLLNA